MSQIKENGATNREVGPKRALSRRKQRISENGADQQ